VAEVVAELVAASAAARYAPRSASSTCASGTPWASNDPTSGGSTCGPPSAPGSGSCEPLASSLAPDVPALAAAASGAAGGAEPAGDAAAAASGGAGPSPGALSELLLYLADGLRGRGFEVAITHALGGGTGGECLRRLRHTFLSVTVPLPPGAQPTGPPSPAAVAVAAAVSLAASGGAATGRPGGGSLSGEDGSAPAGGGGGVPYHPGVIIVDPDLRAQFEVAAPTARLGKGL
jgi:hypothetical protein